MEIKLVKSNTLCLLSWKTSALITFDYHTNGFPFSTLSVDLCTVHQNRSCINTTNWFSFCDRSRITPQVLYYTTGSFFLSLYPLMCTVHQNRSCITPPVLFQTTGFHYVTDPLLHHRFYIKQPVLSLSLPPDMHYGTVNQNRSCIKPPVLFQITGFQFVNGPLLHHWFYVKQPVFSLSLPPNMYGSVSNNRFSFCDNWPKTVRHLIVRQSLWNNSSSFNCSSVPVE